MTQPNANDADLLAGLLNRPDLSTSERAALSRMMDRLGVVEVKPSRRAGRLYRVASVCEAVHHVHASDEADAYHRMMCGEGTLIESDTHDTSITPVRK